MRGYFIRSGLLILMLTLSACGGMVIEQSRPVAQPKPVAMRSYMADPVAAFRTVASRIEPRAEQFCRRDNAAQYCDFTIYVDTGETQAVNAYQTLDKSGRPIIVFTAALLREARNADELAFVLGHEMSHHLAGHLARQANNSQMGALALGGLTAMLGGSDALVDTAARMGAGIGARTYSKTHELEADELGTLLALDAGYDPIRGAEFFTRIPDPGDKFLGSHPPNASRIATVRRTVAKIKGRT